MNHLAPFMPKIVKQFLKEIKIINNSILRCLRKPEKKKPRYSDKNVHMRKLRRWLNGSGFAHKARSLHP